MHEEEEEEQINNTVSAAMRGGNLKGRSALDRLLTQNAHFLLL